MLFVTVPYRCTSTGLVGAVSYRIGICRNPCRRGFQPR